LSSSISNFTVGRRTLHRKKRGRNRFNLELSHMNNPSLLKNKGRRFTREPGINKNDSLHASVHIQGGRYCGSAPREDIIH
jgi:hypothetical protein